MGWIRHHAIIVVSWSGESIEKAATKAQEIGLQIVGPSAAAMNGYRSFLVCPDGSKEGWEDSNAGDERRAEFKKWLRDQSYSDGSNSLSWSEVVMDSDNFSARIEDGQP